MKCIKRLMLLVSMVTSLSANAVLVTPDQTLKVDFALTGLPQSSVDVLTFDFRSISFFGAGFQEHTDFWATLMDGPNALGTAYTGWMIPSDPQRRQFMFVSESSLFSANSPGSIDARVDLASLLNGTINGSILITANQAYDINFSYGIDRNFELNYSHGVSSDALSQTLNFPNYAYATSFSILSQQPPVSAVPLPNSAVLLLAGLFTLFLTRYKQTVSSRSARVRVKADRW